jgi:hypothetical protein
MRPTSTPHPARAYYPIGSVLLPGSALGFCCAARPPSLTFTFTFTFTNRRRQAASTRKPAARRRTVYIRSPLPAIPTDHLSPPSCLPPITIASSSVPNANRLHPHAHRRRRGASSIARSLINRPPPGLVSCQGLDHLSPALDVAHADRSQAFDASRRAQHAHAHLAVHRASHQVRFAPLVVEEQHHSYSAHKSPCRSAYATGLTEA